MIKKIVVDEKIIGAICYKNEKLKLDVRAKRIDIYNDHICIWLKLD